MSGRETIICLNCNKEVTVWKHAKAKFCSYQCSADHKKSAYLDKWLREEINGTYETGTSTGLNKRIKKYFKENVHHCQICNGEKEWNNKPLTFEIDHIDGDRTNNFFSNLRYICPNCHSQTDTFRAKNMKKIASLA